MQHAPGLARPGPGPRPCKQDALAALLPLLLQQLLAALQLLLMRSTHLGPLALVQSRTRMLPYTTWNVRPTGGKNGKTTAVTLSVPGLQELVSFEVCVSWSCSK